MPFRKRLERWKDEFKQGLGLSSEDLRTVPGSSSNRVSASLASAHRAQVPNGDVSSNHSNNEMNPSIAQSLLSTSLQNSAATPSKLQSSPVISTSPSVWSSSPFPSTHPPLSQRTSSTAWAGAKSLLSILGTSVNIFPPLKSAINGLNECIELFDSVSEGRQEYDDIRTRLDSLLRDLYLFLSTPGNRMMTTSMKNFCIGIQEEVRLIQEKHARNGTQIIIEALRQSDELLQCYRRIQEHLERLMLNANLNIWQIVDRQETEARLRQLLPTMSAVYNSAESQDVQRRPCTPGTRELELNKLLAWVHDEKSKSVYWINGMAGTGKTTIAYSFCDMLEKAARLGASFFCSRSIPECRNVKLIIPAIAYQLARFSHPFRYALSQALESDPDVHTRVPGAQFDGLIVKPLQEVKHALPADFVIVIDALDECENENGVGQILDILLSCTATSDLPVRFLLSSRPESEIYFRIMNKVEDSPIDRLVLHDLDAEVVKHDIETYLKTELKEVNLTPSQLTALVEHSGVLFLYASTSARYIKDGFRLMEHEERLDMILGLASPSTSNKDRDIDELYASILKAAFEKKYLDESSRARMKVLLDAIICLQEPITVGGLAALLKLKSGSQVDALLRPLRSVLNIAESSGTVTTLHASFPEFMLNEYRSSSFYCDPWASHKRLAQACFRRIEDHHPQFNICNFQSSYLRDNDVDGLEERLVHVVPVELLYACNNWANHLELSEPCENLIQSASDFLSMRLLLWMEVLNVKRSVHTGAPILRKAEKWSQGHNCSEEIVALARDAWRFVAMFASHSVSQSTPHLYLSMLPFWPESSPVSKAYMQRIGEPIVTNGALTMNRQLALLSTWSFESTIVSACFSPDGSRILCGPGFNVYVIDSTTGKPIVGPLKHDDLVNSVAFSPDGTVMASGSDDKTIRVWNSENGQLVAGPFAEHSDAVTSVCFSPDGTRIASGSDDMTVRVWDIRAGKTVVGPLAAHTDAIKSVRFSADGNRIATGSSDKTIRIWDSNTGDMTLGPLEGHTGTVNSVCFSPDDTKIASASNDEKIRLWSTQDGRMIFDPLSGHSDCVASAEFSPDGNWLVSSSYDSTLMIWDIHSTPISSRILAGHTNTAESAVFSPDGSHIVSTSLDNTVRLWDPQVHSPVSSSADDTVLTVAFSPDGKQFASGSTDNIIRIWNSENGQMISDSLVGHSSWIQSVSYSPNGTHIVSGSDDKTLRIWDVKSGQTVVGPLKGHTDFVNIVTFSPNGSLIASGSSDTTIRLWNAVNGEAILSPFQGHTDDVISICFSPDGMRLVSGSADDTIRVWDVNSGQTVIGPLRDHKDEISSVQFSPDGTQFVSASLDSTIRGWDSSSGELVLGPIKGHTSDVQGAVFSPDGSFLVSCSDDKTIRFWDAESGQAVGSPLRGHAGWVLSLVLSPQGTRLLTISEDKAIRMWDVSDILGVREHSPIAQQPDSSLAARPYQAWALQDDGWVVDTESRLLAWVPPDLHVALVHPRNTFMILNKGSFQLDFDSSKLGDSWVEHYKPIQPAIKAQN